MKPIRPIPRGYSPSPIRITLRPGQVVIVGATDDSGEVPEGSEAAAAGFGAIRSGDSPRKSPDSPRKSPDSPRKSPDRH